MTPYWRFQYIEEKRLYYKETATKWFCIESMDHEHWVNIPLDSPECYLPINQVIGRFFKDVAQEMLR